MRSAPMQGVYGTVVRVKGVKPAMLDMRPKDRQWVRTRLRPAPMQHVVEAALEAFAQALAHK